MTGCQHGDGILFEQVPLLLAVEHHIGETLPKESPQQAKGLGLPGSIEAGWKRLVKSVALPIIPQEPDHDAIVGVAISPGTEWEIRSNQSAHMHAVRGFARTGMCERLSSRGALPRRYWERVGGEVVKFDHELYITCMACVPACPEGAVAFDEETEYFNICDLCDASVRQVVP